MLPSINSLRNMLPSDSLAIGGGMALMLGLFLWPMYYVMDISTPFAFAIWGGGACAGLALGVFFVFRSRCGTTHALCGFCGYLLTLELMLPGGCVSLLMQVAGRPDAVWMALGTHLFVMLISLAGGMYNEAKRLGAGKGDSSGNWRKWLEKNIDYTTNRVIPTFSTASTDSGYKGTGTVSPSWIVPVGTANIPLLFELYGGGRAHAILLAAPVAVGLFAYLNLKSFGPALLRVLLLRKLENEHGCRFQNADYEQIQELRRGFFLARWLMKDYRPPMPLVEAETSPVPSRQETKKRKRRR